MKPIVKRDKKQIKWIFWGLIFVHFHVNINQVDLLPDFVGFILFYLALNGLAMDTSRYNSIKVLAIAMAAVEIYNLLKLITSGNAIYYNVWTVGFVIALLYAMFDYLLFGVVLEVSEDYGCDARIASLTMLRKLRLGFNLFSAVAGVLGTKLPVIATIITVLGIIVMVYSCVEVRRLWLEMEQVPVDAAERREGGAVCAVVPKENEWIPPVEADEPISMDIPEVK